MSFFNRLEFLFSNRRTRSMNFRCMYKLIPKEKAKEMIINKEAILIDVRTENEYDMVKIKNAINIPVNNLKKNIATVAPQKNAAIIVYCASGYRSVTAIKILNGLGYNNIYIWEDAAIATFNYKDMLVYGNEN